MLAAFSFFPQEASTSAAQVDHLYYFLLTVSGLVAMLIFCLILYFAVRYRRRSENERTPLIRGSLKLEVFWTVTPFLIFMGMFIWGARIFFADASPPPNAEEVLVVGKQWMWKLQHMEGQREIDELHVPVGKPIKLTMTSEDVIHSFFVPAFRVKHDVLPGRYSQLWFQATKVGTYHLFCAEYCGAQHSKMIGSIIVMKPQDYQQWLSGGAERLTPVEAGRKLFVQLGCNACHQSLATAAPLATSARGPNLKGIFGSKVTLQNGETATVDDDYLRESILNPSAKLTVGYRPVMPTFKGLVTEENVMQLIAYIKSLSVQEGNQTNQ